MKILIAEDDIPSVKLYEIIFKNDEVSVCLNGEDFIMEYKDTYDVFIIDLTMPKLNGYDVINFLKSIDNKVPIIVCTAFVSDIVKDILNDKLIIQKPINVNSLRNHIIKYIEECAR